MMKVNNGWLEINMWHSPTNREIIERVEIPDVHEVSITSVCETESGFFQYTNTEEWKGFRFVCEDLRKSLAVNFGAIPETKIVVVCHNPGDSRSKEVALFQRMTDGRFDDPVFFYVCP